MNAEVMFDVGVLGLVYCGIPQSAGLHQERLPGYVAETAVPVAV